MYNLVKYSSTYSETTGSLEIYSKVLKMKQLTLMIIILQTLTILNMLSIRLSY